MAEVQKTSGSQRVAAAIAAACLVAAPLTASFEGLRTRPYRDDSPRHVESVCYGDTQVEMRRYTPAECLMLLRTRQARDYAPLVINCVPGFADPAHRNAFAASIDAAYNGGPVGTAKHPGFCRSEVAAKFNRGDWVGGCNALPGWHTLPGTRVHNGLLRRRLAERALCLKGTAS